jgi:hypothetical protein
MIGFTGFDSDYVPTLFDFLKPHGLSCMVWCWFNSRLLRNLLLMHRKNVFCVIAKKVVLTVNLTFQAHMSELMWLTCVPRKQCRGGTATDVWSTQPKAQLNASCGSATDTWPVLEDEEANVELAGSQQRRLVSLITF